MTWKRLHSFSRRTIHPFRIDINVCRGVFKSALGWFSNALPSFSHFFFSFQLVSISLKDDGNNDMPLLSMKHFDVIK